MATSRSCETASASACRSARPETAYNGFGEITAIALTRGGVQRHRQTFERGAHGELTAIEHELDGQPLRWTYAFDLEGRLIRADSDAGRTIDYAYDAAGNHRRGEQLLIGPTPTTRQAA